MTLGFLVCPAFFEARGAPPPRPQKKFNGGKPNMSTLIFVPVCKGFMRNFLGRSKTPSTCQNLIRNNWLRDEK